jgi:hypothetical protein
MSGEDDGRHGIKDRVYFGIEHRHFNEGIHVLLDAAHDVSYLIEKF